MVWPSRKAYETQCKRRPHHPRRQPRWPHFGVAILWPHFSPLAMAPLCVAIFWPHFCEIRLSLFISQPTAPQLPGADELWGGSCGNYHNPPPKELPRTSDLVAAPKCGHPPRGWPHFGAAMATPRFFCSSHFRSTTGHFRVTHFLEKSLNLFNYFFF